MSIRLQVDNSFTTVLDPLSKDQLKRLSDYCSYTVEGAHYSPQYQSKVWDGKKRLFNTMSYTFPSGLLPEIVAKGIIDNPEVLDVRVRPQKKIKSSWVFPHPLRDYQTDTVEKCLRYQRGIVNSCTGSGKTVVAMRVAHELGVKTLIIVNTKEAFKDTVATYNACIAGDQVGTWGAGSKRVFGRFVTVATMASVVKAYESKDPEFLQQNFQCVFIDECHHLGADTWTKVMYAINAYYKFGLTGTPFRHGGSKMLLRATTGKILIEVKAKDLQAKGQLSKAEITFIEVSEPSSLDRPMDYKEAYMAGIVGNKVRNAVIEKLVIKHIEDVKLITVEVVEHGEELLRRLKKIDPTAIFVHGKTKDRDGIKDRFVAGELRTVIATRIYNESADIPILKVGINAAGGKSGIAVIQRLGRKLRLHESKDVALEYDFYDSFNFSMEQHSMERIKWLKKEGHAVKTLQIAEVLNGSLVKLKSKRKARGKSG